MEKFDVIVIGGGPSGLNCAIAAARRGVSCLVLEKGMLVNSIYHFPANMTFFSTSVNLEIDDTPFISHSDKPTRREALEYYRRLVERFHLKVQTYEPVLGMNLAEGNVWQVQTSHQTYTCRAVVVATGFYDTPRLLGIPGEDLPKVTHYYNDPHPYIGKDVLVIGAANSACDVALETWQKGAKVTMAIRENEIYPKVKYWIKPNIENRIKEGSIQAHFNTSVLEITAGAAHLRGPEGDFWIDNDFVLAMTGYQPNYTFLNSLGLNFSAQEDCLPTLGENLETNLPNVFMAGVVCAGLRTSQLFIENTRDHGDIILDAIVGRLQAGT